MGSALCWPSKRCASWAPRVNPPTSPAHHSSEQLHRWHCSANFRPGQIPDIIGTVAMLGGIGLIMRERHSHAHTHERIVHEHLHVHDEHHQHKHVDEPILPEPHSHQHTHSTVKHEHPHVSDVHHRHGHQLPSESGNK